MVKSDLVSEPISGSSQLVVVKTASWDAVDGFLSLHERRGVSWITIRDRTPVVLGKKGLARSRSLLNPESIMPGDGPVKQEGDGRSPSGVFRLGAGFGFGDKPAGTELEYVKLTEYIECVDDVASRHYNRMVDRRDAGPVDWKSSEKMSAIPQYRLGIVVEYNTSPVISGAGSCIFLHLWEEPSEATTGCTAMSGKDLLFLLAWLDPLKNPLLVQLTEETYRSFRTPAGLP
jgi:D-alanyl-D-alanine dipeptidase